jgi:uncharacterized protein YacL
MFGDLTTISNTNTQLSFVSAALVVEMVFLILFRLTNSPLTGKEINEWYDVYKLDAILLDTLSVVIGFILASVLYPFLFSEFNLGFFLLVVLGVQIIHDYLFWRYVIVPIPEGHNQIIDTMKKYAKQAKGGAIIGDSIMYVLGVPIASILLYLANSYGKGGVSLLLGISVFALYPIMYLLYTKPVKNFGR